MGSGARNAGHIAGAGTGEMPGRIPQQAQPPVHSPDSRQPHADRADPDPAHRSGRHLQRPPVQIDPATDAGPSESPDGHQPSGHPTSMAMGMIWMAAPRCHPARGTAATAACSASRTQTGSGMVQVRDRWTDIRESRVFPSLCTGCHKGRKTVPLKQGAGQKANPQYSTLAPILTPRHWGRTASPEPQKTPADSPGLTGHELSAPGQR